MSYEGYVQYLCKEGHSTEKDCYEDDLRICRCGSPIVWRNGVDVTNGSFEGRKRIDGYVNLKIKAQRNCDKCGTILETTYVIPKNKGYLTNPTKGKLNG
jgi:hypothetical protein